MESPLDPNYNGVMSNIPPGYKHGILDTIVREELNNMYGNANITITPIEPDYRSGQQQQKKYSVNYSKEVNGVPIEIEGTLNPYHTGRSVEYGFEPSYFDDKNVEAYWDENWEAIEDEIHNQFYSQKY